MGEQLASHVDEKSLPTEVEKSSTPHTAQREDDIPEDHNLVYDDVEEEPEIHMRTYVALASMFLLNLVQVFALQGPPAVVSLHEIAMNLMTQS